MILAVGDFWSTLSAAGPAHAAELTLGATILAVLVSGAVLGRDSRRMAVIAFGGTLAALAMMYIFSTPSTGEALSASTASGSPVLFVLDHTAIIFRYVALIVLLGVIGLWSSSDADRERHSPEFMTLLLASALGMLLMSSAANLLVMLVAIELASMPSFALVAFDRHRRSAAEAGVKYVLFGATTSGFAIFGASILFGVFQTLDLPTLAHRVEQSLNAMSAAQTALVALSLFALFAGIAFKIAAVPFHFWCPDVFEGASLSVATWLSIASKAAGVVLIVRIAGFFGVADSSGVPSALSATICISLALLACLTITIGNLAAFGQRSVRRLLAYSSIAHAGYMLAFAAIPAAAGDPLGSASLAIYIVIYALMNFGAFAALAVVADDTGREPNIGLAVVEIILLGNEAAHFIRDADARRCT
jgi:NADH-quinone oxidoreductase subunit N